MNISSVRLNDLLSVRSPLVMGIINCTPDSFFPGSRRSDPSDAVRTAMEMIERGADILDVGGESTRPGSEYTDAAEELERIIPVIREIRKKSDALISVDTRKAGVAEAALDAGADIINDISALTDDPALAPLAAGKGVPVILMHRKGTPLTMQNNPSYGDVVREVRDELVSRAAAAKSCGIRKDNIILDPGIGFGKRFEDNLALLRNLSVFKSLGYPVLVGLSRKGFLGTALGGRPVEDRLAGSLAAAAWCILEGASILRVHDVAETVDVCRILHLIRTAG